MQTNYSTNVSNEIGKALSDVNTVQLGNIINQNSDGSVTVELLAKRVFSGVEESQPLLENVRINQVETNGFRISIPLGELPCPCTVYFNQYPLDEWEGYTDNHTERRHDLTDAYVVVGMPSKSTVPIDDNFTIQSQTSTASIQMSKDGKFRLNNSDGVDLLTLVGQIAEALSNTKAVVTKGSSGGSWDIDTQGEFANIASKLKGLTL